MGKMHWEIQQTGSAFGINYFQDMLLEINQTIWDYTRCGVSRTKKRLRKLKEVGRWNHKIHSPVLEYRFNYYKCKT